MAEWLILGVLSYVAVILTYVFIILTDRRRSGMAEMMNFPDDWHDFIKSNSFVDREEIYTNGARLMTELRVEQLVEHILREKEQQWVSVKDRLPKDGIFVLVCNDDGHMMLAKWESEAVRWEYKYMNYDWDVWDEEEQGPICYWMPLPEPPKEDEDD